jgi:hypothetical protein
VFSASIGFTTRLVCCPVSLAPLALLSFADHRKGCDPIEHGGKAKLAYHESRNSDRVKQHMIVDLKIHLSGKAVRGCR